MKLLYTVMLATFGISHQTSNESIVWVTTSDDRVHDLQHRPRAL